MRVSKTEDYGRRPRVMFGAVSVPIPVLEEIDGLIEDLGHWPSRSAFVREACLEKIERVRIIRKNEKIRK